MNGDGDSSSQSMPIQSGSGGGGRARSRLATPLLIILIPALVGAMISFPLFVVFSFVPILGFIALPSLLSVTVFSLYALPWILYLVFAQFDPPPSVTLPFLPYSPSKCLKIVLTFFQFARDFISSGYLQLWFDLQLKKVSSYSSNPTTTSRGPNSFVKRDLIYHQYSINVSKNPGKPNYKTQARKLDVYKPEGYEIDSNAAEAPVIVLVGGANWRMWDKTLGSQIALRLRRLGYCVVVPDWSQAPAKTPEMVTDLRMVLEWVEERIKTYNGDADSLYVLGYGSGAHLAALTIVQDAVVRSRDEYLDLQASPSKPSTPQSKHPDHSAASELIEISAGIRRCSIWGEQARLPPISGMILVAGVFDVIKQLRFEAKCGIEDLSALRRVCGPGTGASLLSCPSHLLYGAKEILDPTRLPPKWLIIAGGKDTSVPYTQSVLLRSLLTGVGVAEVRLKLYRELSHIGSICSLMHQTRYSPLFLSEIEAIVSE